MADAAQQRLADEGIVFAQPTQLKPDTLGRYIMANEHAPWMLTVGQLREVLTDVPEDVAVALVQPRSTDGLTVIQSVNASYSGGPILTLTPALPPPESNAQSASPTSPKRQTHHSDYFVEQFGYAIGRAGCFELKARLLADKTPKLQSQSLSADLTPLCKDIVSEYSAALQNDDRKLLAALPGIRNKLLHVELSRAQGRIKPFAEALNDASVTKVDLQTGETLRVTVSSTQQGRLFGWLLEAGSSGALRIASDLFFHGIVLVERLMLECDKRMAGSV